MHNAVYLAHHMAAQGDLRGAWETYRCVIRMVAALDDDEDMAQPLSEALEACATEIDLGRQVTALRRVLDQAAGPSEVGEADIHPRDWAMRAISLGAPAYNAGDHRGCYEVYAATARLLLSILSADAPQWTEARDRLATALRRCSTLASVNEQAWAMRHALDGIIRPPVAGTAEIRAALQQAISVGAPTYNSGDHRGCYEIYAATARLVVANYPGGEEAKQRLQVALEQCSQLDDPNEQAWAMRHAFDSILAGA
jgi:hypothetical protein